MLRCFGFHLKFIIFLITCCYSSFEHLVRIILDLRNLVKYCPLFKLSTDGREISSTRGVNIRIVSDHTDSDVCIQCFPVGRVVILSPECHSARRHCRSVFKRSRLRQSPSVVNLNKNGAMILSTEASLLVDWIKLIKQDCVDDT